MYGFWCWGRGEGGNTSLMAFRSATWGWALQLSTIRQMFLFCLLSFRSHAWSHSVLNGFDTLKAPWFLCLAYEEELQFVSAGHVAVWYDCHTFLGALSSTTVFSLQDHGLIRLKAVEKTIFIAFKISSGLYSWRLKP